VYREITTVNSPTYQITIPENLRGRKIEILAFEIQSLENNLTEIPSKTSFEERTKHLLFSANGYKFDRNDANNYE
jgi:hypothetical protein